MSTCLCLMLSSITNQINLLVFIGYYKEAVLLCKINSRTRSVLISVGITLTYIFLWLRQYAFYNSSDFRHMNSKPVRVVSSLVIAVLVLRLFVSGAVHASGLNITWLKGAGCRFTPNGQFFKTYILFFSILNPCITVVLFGLFLRPLLVKSEAQNGHQTSAVDSNKKEIKRAVCISTFSLIACIVSDVLIHVVARVFHSTKVPIFYISSFNDLTLLINIAAVIATYHRCGEILFGFCRRNLNVTDWMCSSHSSYIRNCLTFNFRLFILIPVP